MSIGITALIPSASKDVVAIYIQDDEGNDELILEDASLIRASIDERVTFYKHPLENGRNLVDHRIIEPVTLEIQIILVDTASVAGGLLTGEFFTRARDVYEQIRKIFIAGTVLSIQTRTNTYRNQVLQSMPHEETARIFNGVTLSFRTSEIQFETANVASSVPEDAEDLGLVARGTQALTNLSTSAAAAVTNIAAQAFGD